MQASRIPWKKGQKVEVHIVEVLSKRALIVDYQGDLFRVSNESNEDFQKNQKLILIVRSEFPLQFQIQHRHQPHLDRFA